MADKSGQADIRGLQIQKVVEQYEDEMLVFKPLVTVTSTSAREIRWYQKTAGYLDSTDTSGITASQLGNVPDKALPVAVEQSFTRNTSYVRKYFVESPIISQEDIKDSDVDILLTNIRDLTTAIAYQVDSRIWDVMTESQSPSNINSNASTAAWNATSGQDPIADLATAKENIRTNAYADADNAVLFLSPKDENSLITWLISTKGTSLPNWSSEMAKSGMLQSVLGLRVVVSNNVTADYACVAVPNKAVTWKQFTPITARTIEEVGIGTKIRVWEEGEALLVRPKYVNLITNTQL